MTVREEKFCENIFSQIEIIIPIPKLLNPLQNVVIVHELEDRHNADPSTADVDPLPVGVEEDLGPGVVVHADQFDLLLEDELPSLVVEAVDLQQGYMTVQYNLWVERPGGSSPVHRRPGRDSSQAGGACDGVLVLLQP